MKTRYSWVVVIIMLCVFWPIGLYMLIKNISQSSPKTTAKPVRGTVFLVIGCLFAFATIGALTSIGEGNGTAAVEAVAFLAIAVVLISVGLSIKKRQKTFAKYIRVLSVYNRIPLDKVAPMIPASLEQTTADVEKLVAANLINGLFIDYSTREVVNPSATENYYASNVYYSTQKVVIECKNCLASNEVPRNNHGCCQYCGARLD